MPLLVHAVSWWIAGLLAAAWWETPAPMLLLFAVAALVLVRARRIETLLLPAGVLVGHADALSAARCRPWLADAAQHGRTVWLLIDERQAESGRRPARARGRLRERPHAARCTVPATAEFALGGADYPRADGQGGPPGAAPVHVGDLVPITALARTTATGVRLSAAKVNGARVSRATFTAWRAQLGQRIDGAFRDRAPLVRALLIADQQGIAPDVRDRYADAGLVHLLSVSGMHVAIIAGALLTVGGALRLPKRWSEPIALGGVTAYVVLLGCPAPAVRSGVMLAVLAISARRQRPVHEWTALALGAALPTVQPSVVHDLGWQLSVAGMAALVSARALRRRWRQAYRRRSAHHDNGWSVRAGHWLVSRRGLTGWLVAEVFTGTVAVIVTAPVIAWIFGRLSLVAPLSNVLAGPIIGVLQPALFAALLWALLVPTAFEPWLPDATQPLMALLDLVADGAAAVPGAVLPVAPTLATAVGLGLAAALVVRGSAAARGRTWNLAAMLVAVVTLWLPLLPLGHGALELHVLDVGQGDALALRTPRGRWVLIDAGRRWDGGDAGRRVVIPYVRRHGGDVALFVLSHPHDDHAGGAASVVRALEPALWWEPAFVTTSAGYRNALVAVRETGARWERVRPGRRFVLDRVVFTVLAPDSAWTAGQHDANETSVMLRVEFGAHRLLLTGDAERHEESWLLQHHEHAALTADVLKLGHHGSRTSTTPALLDAVRPRLALASVGAGNKYGHPAPETLAALLARGIPLLRTDLEGTIVVRSDGRTLSVHAGGDHWILPRNRGVE